MIINYHRDAKTYLDGLGGFLCSSKNLNISLNSFFIFAAICCGNILRVSCS